MDDFDSAVKTLMTTCDNVGKSFDDFRKKYDGRLDDIERKANIARLGSGQNSGDVIDHAQQFLLGVKSLNPSRAKSLLGPDGHPNSGFDYDLYRKSFGKYARYGLDNLDTEERKAMTVGSDSEGGFLAPSEFAREIINVEHDNSVMRSIARTLPIGAGEIEFPASLTRPATGWVGETGARTATNAGALGLKRFTAGEIYAQPEATQKLIDDSQFDIEAFLGEQIGLAFAEDEDEAFINGGGIERPRGFTTYDTTATADSAGTRPWGTIEHIATGQAGAWPTTDAAIYDKLIDVVHALRPAYRRRAQWVMPTSVIARLRKMKTATTSEPIWQPSLIAGSPDRLLGYPVVEAEQMPAVAANSLSVAFADWQRAYWIVDRLGVRLLRDPYTNKPYVRFYTTKRVGGGVADSSAIKLLKFAAA